MGVKVCADQEYDIEIALSSIAAKMMQHKKKLSAKYNGDW